MIKRIVSLAFTSVCCMAIVSGQKAATTKETPTYRPIFHFSPAKNWTNDPNGLVYYGGVYHMFYQYNPYGDLWGHMTWAHATSKDLMRWDDLPIAIPEYKNGDGTTSMIFSGTAVADKENTSGFGNKTQTPLIAI